MIVVCLSVQLKLQLRMSRMFEQKRRPFYSVIANVEHELNTLDFLIQKNAFNWVVMFYCILENKLIFSLINSLQLQITSQRITSQNAYDIAARS